MNTRNEFVKAMTEAVQEYIDNFYRFDSDPQIQVNPLTRSVELVSDVEMLSAPADSDEAIENAAHGEGDETEAADDYQVSKNPDFYAVKKLLVTSSDGVTHPDGKAIADIADTYFG